MALTPVVSRLDQASAIRFDLRPHIIEEEGILVRRRLDPRQGPGHGPIFRPVLGRPPGEGAESRPGRFSPSDC
jgi:hypothetical protein